MRPVVLLALLAACNGGTLDPSQDADGDGFSADQGDCDDTNTGIFPGQTERCDGVDSDCDGEDGGDDLTGAATFYEDTDADGYGAADTAVEACEAPDSGWVELAGDCAPEDAAVNPGAEEVCDGVDNNCSGEVDDGLPAVYADADGDGYGDPGAPLTGCEIGDNRTDNDDDCDDTDAEVTPETVWYFDTDEDGYGIDEVTEVSCTSPGGDYALQSGDCRPNDALGYPGAEEICDNGQQPQNIDDNCNGEVDEGCEDLVSCETITSDTTWSGDMVVPCDIIVEGTPTPTLTIADGTTVRFGAGRQLVIGRLDLGRLVVEGGAQGVTLSSNLPVPAAGDWAGLILDNAPGSTVTGLTIEYAGADGAGLVLAADDTVVTDLTLQDIDGVGIRVEGLSPSVTDLTGTDITGAAVDCSAGADISITNATLSDVGSPLVTHLDCADAYSGTLDFASMTEPYATVSGLVISESATWSNLGVPYRLTQGANVAGSSELATWTIEPGVTLEVAQGERVSVGAAGDGELVAVGTSVDPIVFMSDQPAPAAGDWTGLVIQQDQSTTTLTNVELHHTGSSEVFDAALYISADDASVVADGLLVTAGAKDGITVWNGTLDLGNSTITNMAGDGLVVDAFGDLTGVMATSVTHNGGAARFANSDAITRIAASTTFANNTDERIRVPDMTLKRDSTWQDFGVPYLIETSLTVADNGGTQLSLTGTHIEFAEGAQLQIGFAGGQTGSLIANGAEFRGEGSSPGAGFWNGIAGRDDISIVNSTIRHAGAGFSSGVDLYTGSSTLTGNLFEDIDGAAINCWPTSGPHVISGNTFTNVDTSTSGCN